jgi:hypothetical protein
MKMVSKIAAAALLGLGAFMVTTSTASAAIVCNGDGACWHTRHAYVYHPEWGVVVHPNSWRWGPADHFVWREHTGRGYWRGGAWVRF